MSADIAARLRSLAQDYHEGRLDLAGYRSLRAPLLDSLVVNGPAAPALEITQPRAAGRQSQREAVTSPGQPRPAAREGVTSRSNAPLPITQRLGLVGIVIGVLAGATVAFWVWRERVIPGQNNSATDVSRASEEATERERVRDLVAQFLERGDWSDGRLTSLNATLVELRGSELATVARETWFQRFVDELRRRLKEQQALAATTLTVDNSPLAALAVTVGLDLNSPDAAIHIAAATPPRTPDDASPALATPSLLAEHRAASAGAASPTHEGARPPAGANANYRLTAGSDATAASDAAAGPADAAIAASATTANSKVTFGPTAGAAAGEDPCRVELIRSRRPLCHDSLPAGAEGPLLALVPAGAFDMGSTVASEEQPVRHVTISEPFAVSVYEVSQGEFKQFCEYTHRACPSQPWLGEDYPVVNVSWDDARAYTEWLSSVTHHRYSLPTEAQWEYAARAGQTGLFPSGSTLSPTDANYSMLTKQTVAARRSQRFNANAFRLVHSVGNVREWVEDAWVQSFAGAPNDGSAVKSPHATMRVARGGSYADGSARLRLSMREGLAPDTRDVTTGFRIVRELP